MAGKQRRQKARFREFIASLSSDGGDLPLVHTSSAYSFDEIAHANKLKPPGRCRHFGEELVYLYYGRPAYRTQASKSARLRFNYPFIFIFDPEKIDTIRRIFPFDTGAFDDGLFDAFYDKTSKLDDFELGSQLENARRLSNGIYGSHRNYVKGVVEKNLEVPLSGFEAQGVIEQARLPPYLNDGRPDEVTLDERSSSIEVQVQGSIRIADAIIGLVLPQMYLSESYVVEAIDRWSPKVLRTYEVFEMHSPGSWMSLVYQQVVAAYEELGYLDEN